MNEIGRMTMYEYDLLMTGVLLRKQDEDELLHRSAWLSRQVEATKLDGKTPLYKKYSDFYKKKDTTKQKYQLSEEEKRVLLKANLK
jgi:phage protein|nr:MAG TPA: hypothetical protein [Caudoviricetes sp.]